MKIKDDECQLINILHIFNLKVNLLFEKRFMKILRATNRVIFDSTRLNSMLKSNLSRVI